MTVVAAIVLFPLVLVYQAWSLWVFRKRLVGPPEPAQGALTPKRDGPDVVSL